MDLHAHLRWGPTRPSARAPGEGRSRPPQPKRPGRGHPTRPAGHRLLRSAGRGRGGRRCRGRAARAGPLVAGRPPAGFGRPLGDAAPNNTPCPSPPRSRCEIIGLLGGTFDAERRLLEIREAYPCRRAEGAASGARCRRAACRAGGAGDGGSAPRGGGRAGRSATPNARHPRGCFHKLLPDRPVLQVPQGAASGLLWLGRASCPCCRAACMLAHACGPRLLALPGTSVELDAESQVEVGGLMEERGQVPVGWYHSHPVFEPRPSQKGEPQGGARAVRGAPAAAARRWRRQSREPWQAGCSRSGLPQCWRTSHAPRPLPGPPPLPCRQ